jgi:hypothetical protein
MLFLATCLGPEHFHDLQSSSFEAIRDSICNFLPLRLSHCAACLYGQNPRGHSPFSSYTV